MKIRRLPTMSAVALLLLFALGLSSATAFAEGTEILGPPAITIEQGSGIAASGVGLRYAQPGVIDIDVPAGTTVKQVLLYWEGQMMGDSPGDDKILVDGNPVTGTLIGGQTFFFNGVYNSCFRADITVLGLVGAGPNSLSIEGMDFTRRNNGAGLIVIYDDGSTTSEIEIRDGIDLAFVGFPEPRLNTIPQTFFFDPADSERTADLVVCASGVGGAARPNSIEITVDGTMTVLSNALFDNMGPEWDTLTVPVTIPADASMLTVQLFSRDDLASGYTPASLAWSCAALSVPEAPGGPYQGLTPGFWKQSHHFQYWTGYAPNQDYETVFGVDASFNKDLLGALKQGGGGQKALGRHAVAAMLNAANINLNYLYSEPEVISIVQDAYSNGDFESAKNMLEAQNQLGAGIK